MIIIKKKEIDMKNLREVIEESDKLLDRVTFLLDELYAIYAFDTKHDDEITKLQDDIDKYFVDRELDKKHFAT
jgi:hypothetical protein